MKKHVALLIICLGLAPTITSKAAADNDLLPYQNAKLTPHERAIDLLGRLTLKEKAQLMCDISEAIPRLGIKTFNWWSEALHGVANQSGVTVFPEPIGMAANLKFDLGKENKIDYEQSIAKLKDVDVVVFVGGLSSRLEGEEMPIDLPGFKGGDRTDIELPTVQRNFLKALKEAGKKVVLVNCSGSAVALQPETESCDAILQAWYAGERGGQAVADVLFGDYNPSGKLPITFYKTTTQLPDYESYSMKGRTYRYMTDPLFPFGFGLSYTTFTVGTAQISKAQVKTGDEVKLTVPVSNTGKRDGTEILQIYVSKQGDSTGPIKTLKAFKRVPLKAGETQQVEINLDKESFEFFDDGSNTMRTISGEYILHYGTSSDAKDLKTVSVKLL